MSDTGEQKSPLERVRHAVGLGAPALLLLILLLQLLRGPLFGDSPRPQIPPDGYLAYESRVQLSWFKGDHTGLFQVQLAVGDDFDQPLVNRTVSESKLTLPALEPGRRYCWRVLAADDAKVTCFHTAASTLPY